MQTEDVKRLKELEAENVALKGVVGARLWSQQLTQKQSLRLLGLTRASFIYGPGPDRNVRLKERILEVAGPGRGYRLAWLDLKEEFEPLSQKRVYRAWKQLGMALKTKFRKQRIGPPMPGSPCRALQPHPIMSGASTLFMRPA